MNKKTPNLDFPRLGVFYLYYTGCGLFPISVGNKSE